MKKDPDLPTFEERDGEIVPSYTGINAPKDKRAEYLDETAAFLEGRPLEKDEKFDDNDIPPEFRPKDSPEYRMWEAQRRGIEAAERILKTAGVTEPSRQAPERDPHYDIGYSRPAARNDAAIHDSRSPRRRPSIREQNQNERRHWIKTQHIRRGR